ncbi:MAG: MaoC/PaaZ C-terminal domain-containing protein [Anaerolineales bacterium]
MLISKSGDGFSFERYISVDDVKKFAEVVGDLNPIHLDEHFAENSFFKRELSMARFSAG